MEGTPPGADGQGVLPVHRHGIRLPCHAHHLEELPEKTRFEDPLPYDRALRPSTENDTRAYLSSVCGELQVPTTYEPDVDDKGTMCRLAAAMSRVENGVPAVMADIEAGWDMI